MSTAFNLIQHTITIQGRGMLQQPPARPLIAEIEQLRRSVDTKNIFSNKKTFVRLIIAPLTLNSGADHIALPSTEQEKLDREWEYFETVCDQVYFILENTKYKLKRQQSVLLMQLNPPPPSPPSPPQEQIMVQDLSADAPPAIVSNVDEAISGAESTIAASSTPAASTMDVIIPLEENIFSDKTALGSQSLDIEMQSPQSGHEIGIDTTRVSTASLLSAAPALDTLDRSVLMDNMLSAEDKLQDTMLDLGDIGNLGDNLGDMDDMINF
ncbi:hypothetical protein EDD11_006092 [Mortierella claussenii]|nr:hypothetical protein EDD11_006092 [Mortierella claussenii]